MEVALLCAPSRKWPSKEEVWPHVLSSLWCLLGWGHDGRRPAHCLASEDGGQVMRMVQHLDSWAIQGSPHQPHLTYLWTSFYAREKANFSLLKTTVFCHLQPTLTQWSNGPRKKINKRRHLHRCNRWSTVELPRIEACLPGWGWPSTGLICPFLFVCSTVRMPLSRHVGLPATITFIIRPPSEATTASCLKASFTLTYCVGSRHSERKQLSSRWKKRTKKPKT